jgi:hypothetical protein
MPFQSLVCLTMKGRQLEGNFEELKPASHVMILGTILNLFDVFAAVFFFSVKFFEVYGTPVSAYDYFLIGWFIMF